VSLPTRPPARRPGPGMKAAFELFTDKDEEVEQWMRLPYIRNGYRRPYLSWSQLCGTMFCPHNEVCNVWSHLVPACFAYHAVARWSSEKDFWRKPEDQAMFVAFLVGMSICFTFSVFYHMFNCKSPRDYTWFLTLDYQGILTLIGASYLPAMHFAFMCYPMWQKLYSSLAIIFFVAGAIPFLTARIQERPTRKHDGDSLKLFIIVWNTCWGMPVIAQYLWMELRDLDGDGHSWDLSPEAKFFAMSTWKLWILYGCGFGLFLTRIPEVYFEHTFDIVGASHQLFHVFVVLAAWSWYDNLLKFYEMQEGHCPAS